MAPLSFPLIRTFVTMVSTQIVHRKKGVCGHFHYANCYSSVKTCHANTKEWSLSQPPLNGNQQNKNDFNCITWQDRSVGLCAFHKLPRRNPAFFKRFQINYKLWRRFKAPIVYRIAFTGQSGVLLFVAQICLPQFFLLRRMEFQFFKRTGFKSNPFEKIIK